MPLQTGIFADLLTEQRERIAAERRTSLENPQTPLSYPAEWLLDIFNGGRTDSGIRVSELTAFQAILFLSCVDLIAGSIATLPKHIYERSVMASGRASHRIAYEHGYYDLVHMEPNPEMSRFVFLKAFMAHVLAWGNGYVELQRDPGNQIEALWPRNPYKTRPYRLHADMRLEPVPWRPFPVTLAAGTLCYRTTDAIDDGDRSDLDAERPGEARFIPAEDMLHVPGLAFDGRVGQSVVWLARQTIGLALATEKFGAKYFANFARPSGLLIPPVVITDQQMEQSKRSWMEAQGGENSHRIAVMRGGWDFKPISNDPEKSQLTETEAAIGLKLCALFHVPPHMVGMGQKGNRSNNEQEAQEFTQYTLSPWIEAIKLEWKRKLFPNSGIGRTPKSRFYIDFDLTDMLRPDAASREKFYSSGRQWAYLNTEDIRAFEKLNPVGEPWAEKYWMPINMTLSDTPLDPNHQDGDGDGGKPGGDADPEADPEAKPEDKASQLYFRFYSRLFDDAFGRILARDRRDLKAVSAAFGPVLFSVRDAWFDLAAMQLRLTARDSSGSDRFVADYLRSLQKRAESWPGDDAQLPSRELRRAIAAMRTAAYREAANLKATEEE